MTWVISAGGCRTSRSSIAGNKTIASADLLYLSPVVPARTGNGLAMRAAAVLRALAGRYRVHLLVVPLYASPTPSVADDLRALCAATATVPLPYGFRSLDALHSEGLANWIQQARPAFPGVAFEVIHYSRLATLPFGAPYVRGRRRWPPWRRRAPRLHLDLDDVESVARGRLAELYRRNGRPSEAAAEEREAQRSRALEAAVLRDFARVYVCSERDRRLVLPRARAEVVVLPNAVDLPDRVRPPPRDGPFTLLFVGTLGYFPNADAVLYFCREILPLLRGSASRRFRLQVVGPGPVDALRDAIGHDAVEVVGAVPDMAPWYDQASAAILPLRAGGGTRIKALEAFAHGRPVVSTSLGVEGIEAVDGEHLLLADSPPTFAEACRRLMVDAALAERLATNALALVRTRYTVAAMARALASGLGPPARRG